jgi:hypothetical protein
MLGFKYAPLEYSHLRHLALRLQMFGKTAVLQLAYLLEAAPFLEDLHLDVSIVVMHALNYPACS